MHVRMRVENVRDLQVKCYKFSSIYSLHTQKFHIKKNYVVYRIHSYNHDFFFESLFKRMDEKFSQMWIKVTLLEIMCSDECLD